LHSGTHLPSRQDFTYGTQYTEMLRRYKVTKGTYKGNSTEGSLHSVAVCPGLQLTKDFKLALHPSTSQGAETNSTDLLGAL